MFKYRVKGGTSSCNLCVILKLKTYLIFYKWDYCGPLCVLFLTDIRLNGLR